MMMGEASLEVEGEKPLTLRLSNLALFNAERFYGKPIEELLADMRSGFATATAAMLRAALLKYHPQLAEDEEAVADLLMENIEAVMVALSQALGAAMQDVDGDAEGNAQSRQVGKSSGGAGAKPGSTRKASGRKRREATT